MPVCYVYECKPMVGNPTACPKMFADGDHTCNTVDGILLHSLRHCNNSALKMCALLCSKVIHRAQSVGGALGLLSERFCNDPQCLEGPRASRFGRILLFPILFCFSYRSIYRTIVRSVLCVNSVTLSNRPIVCNVVTCVISTGIYYFQFQTSKFSCPVSCAYTEYATFK